MVARANEPEAELPATTPVDLRGRLFRKYALPLAGLLSVALIGSGLLSIWFSYREQRTLLVRIQTEQAAAAASKISQFLKEIEGQMGWTTQLAWTTGGTEQRRLEALRLLRQVPAIAQLTLLDASGREQLKVSRLAMDVIGSQIDRSAEPAFIGAQFNKVFHSPVYFRVQSEPYMAVALAGARRDAGVSIAEVNLKFIWDVVSQIKVGERSYAYVIDADGRLIAHPDISLVLSNLDLSYLAQVLTARSNVMSAAQRQTSFDGIHGERVLAAHAAVAPVGWFVFVELPVAEAYAPIYTWIQRAGALLAAALLITILAGLVLTRRMIAPIEALRAGAESIGRGELSQRISIKTGDDLEALGDQFNSMAAQLEESYETLERKVVERTHQLQLANLAKSRFLAAASHDLRQPLHALGLFVAQLRSRLEAADRERVIGRVETSLAALNELFDALLDISKLDAGVLTTSPVAFPIRRIFERLQATFAGASAAKGLSLRIVPSSAWVHTDPILLERILLNLVSNAVRYTPRGRVLVGCRRRAGALDVEVWDTGPGIPVDQRQNIFGEFVRLADPEGKAHPGLGLGLSIVQRLCELLALPIEFDSTLGKGSCFRVTLPLVAAQNPSPAPSAEPAIAIAASANPVVLVVDDDALVREGMSGLLDSWGCRVVTFASAGAALAAAFTWAGRRPDLIIADYSLPDGQSGLDLLAALHDVFGTKVPAFLVSGDTSPDRLREVRDSGFNLLHKPVSPMTLRAMLVRYLKTDETLTATRMRAEPLTT
jgi:signal transduction histidine kinase/ActR/RegA family two-component response regulator